MVTKNDNKRRVQIQSSIRQTVWNYMRRNRTFRFGDVIMITGVSNIYLKNIIRYLKAVDYIIEVEKVKPYTSTQFTLIKYTGVKSPSFKGNTVYDYNTDEELIIEHTPVVSKLLEVMIESKMSKQTISVKADVSLGVCKKWFKKLTELGLINEIKPIEKINKQKVFMIDLEKVEQLKLDIASGSFKIKGALL